MRVLCPGAYQHTRTYYDKHINKLTGVLHAAAVSASSRIGELVDFVRWQLIVMDPGKNALQISVF